MEVRKLIALLKQMEERHGNLRVLLAVDANDREIYTVEQSDDTGESVIVIAAEDQ